MSCLQKIGRRRTAGVKTVLYFWAAFDIKKFFKANEINRGFPVFVLVA